MAKTLVLYYSRKGENYFGGSVRSIPQGNTEIVAGMIRDAVGADLFELDTVEPYPADYTACTKVAQEELRADARPALRAALDSVAGYDNIVVAGPCWWGTYPMAVFTQLDQLDFAGKRVFPVMTHEGSGLAGAPAALKKHCPGAQVGEGLAIQGGAAARSADAVADWARRNLL